LVQDARAGAGVVRLAWPDLGPEEVEAIAEVIASGRLTMGPKVEQFEAELARATETEHAVAVSSGTAALHLGLLALGVGPGDEVLVPAYTFPATANVVAFTGARPVLIDVDAETMNFDPERVAPGPKTKAVIPVHLFGRPAPVERLPDGPAVLEDAAGALGAKRKGKACGSLGVVGCLSFHPRKIVTTGEGGAVVTDDSELADAARMLRHHGWQPPEWRDMPRPGLNYRLSDLLCAVGITQVRRLDELLTARAQLAAAYAERLSDVVQAPAADEGDVHGWQAYVIQLERRDEVLAALREEGIEAQIGTYALHRLSAYHDQGPFPGADRCYERALALPFHNRLAEADLDRVAEVVRRFAG
jgi:dTDP-4-amino-4,6-dideoxygalactose transaminase